MNILAEQVNYLLRNQSFDYAICGGIAIDLFLNMETRKHSDIDILAYWVDRNTIIMYMQSLDFKVYEMLGGGKAHHITNIHNQKVEKRNIFCIKEDCELVQLSETEEQDVFYTNFQHIGQTKLNYIEFLFNDKSDVDFLYEKDYSIKKSLNEAILLNGEIPFLAPEICLLYKSTTPEREGYQHDYDMAISKMNTEQTQWLNTALKKLYPQGHKWIL